MNYRKLYEQIINKALISTTDEYTEKHHIIPFSLGGTNKKDNLVKLTAREHFICHWLLTKIHPTNTKLIYAFNRMCQVSDTTLNRSINSHLFKYAREKLAETNKIVMLGSNNPRYGIWLSEETKQKISNSNKNKFKGKPLSEETKQKMKDYYKLRGSNFKGKKHSEESKKLMSIAVKKAKQKTKMER